jgi:hypothetical protein
MMSLFQPSVKRLRKERIGSGPGLVYDAPSTPPERLQAHPAGETCDGGGT